MLPKCRKVIPARLPFVHLARSLTNSLAFIDDSKVVNLQRRIERLGQAVAGLDIHEIKSTTTALNPNDLHAVMNHRSFADCCALLSNAIGVNVNKAMLVYEHIRTLFPGLWKLEGATLLARMIMTLPSDTNDAHVDKLYASLVRDFRPRLIHEIAHLFRHFYSPYFVDDDQFEKMLMSSTGVLLYCLGLRRIGHNDDKLQNWMREWDVTREKHHRMVRVGQKLRSAAGWGRGQLVGHAPACSRDHCTGGDAHL